jgi:hypothetical protein
LHHDQLAHVDCPRVQGSPLSYWHDAANRRDKGDVTPLPFTDLGADRFAATYTVSSRDSLGRDCSRSRVTVRRTPL